MTSGLRKAGLAAHVVSSVGWLGSVAAFLALAVVGLTSPDGPSVRAAYLAMDRVTWLVIVPLCLGSLFTGVVQSLGTTWGLFRHYWVVFKLGLTLFGTAVLLMHTQAIGYAASVAAAGSFGAEHDEVRIQLVSTALAALLVLLVMTALGVYKPRGLTGYGLRKRREQQ